MLIPHKHSFFNIKNCRQGCKIFFYCLFIFSFCSCQRKSSDHGYFYQDFDNLKCWAPNSKVTREFSHSGSFSSYTDSVNEFSETFVMDLDYARGKKYRRAQITAWCFKPVANTNANLVASVENKDGQITYSSCAFATDLEVPNTWINLVLFLDLPKNAREGTQIKIFLHSAEKEKAFIDDVVIQFIK